MTNCETDSGSVEPLIETWHQRLATTVLRTVAVFALGRMGLLIPELVAEGRLDLVLISLSIYLTVVAAALFGSLRRWRRPLVVVLPYCASLTGFLGAGLVPVAAVDACTAIILGALMYGRRAVVGLLASYVAVAAVALNGFQNGWLLPSSPTPTLAADWVRVLLTIAMWSVAIAWSIRFLVEQLRAALERSEAFIADLRLEARERDAAESDLRAARERLARNNKMEAIGQLAGGLAHDLNNTMTVIIAEAEMLGDDENPDTRASADEVLRAAEQATRLTRQILSFGRRDVAQPVTLDLGALIQDLRRPLERLLSDAVPLTIQIDGSQLWVVADPGLLQQSLFNLAINARDAMQGAGDYAIHVGHGMSGDQPVVSVRCTDTGPGVPQGLRERIFEPFFTTKGVGEGTGLGLANTREIVESVGGKIRVALDAGPGATFVLQFPVSAEPPELPPDLTLPSISGGTGRVLVVEDDIRVRSVIYSTLVDAGYTVDEASDGVGALKQLEGSAYDLLLTDMVMPNMNGVELIEAYHRLRGGGRVLICSGYAPNADLRAAVTAGVYPFLAKPFSRAGLLEAVCVAMSANTPPRPEACPPHR